MALFILIAASIVVILGFILGAPLYYFKYGRRDNKASISKNPNYGLQSTERLPR